MQSINVQIWCNFVVLESMADVATVCQFETDYFGLGCVPFRTLLVAIGWLQK